MAKTELDFQGRPEDEKQWMLENTWCDACSAADLGMTMPREFKDDEHHFLEGLCLKCAAPVRNEIVERNAG